MAPLLQGRGEDVDDDLGTHRHSDGQGRDNRTGRGSAHPSRTLTRGPPTPLPKIRVCDSASEPLSKLTSTISSPVPSPTDPVRPRCRGGERGGMPRRCDGP